MTIVSRVKVASDKDLNRDRKECAMAIFKGAGVALITPFHEDESVNYEALEALVEMQIAGQDRKAHV